MLYYFFFNPIVNMHIQYIFSPNFIIMNCLDSLIKKLSKLSKIKYLKNQNWYDCYIDEYLLQCIL